MRRRICALIILAAMTAGALCGCGDNSSKAEPETETGSAGGQATEEVASSQEVPQEETQLATEEPEVTYPEIVSDQKVEDYGSVVAVGDTAYELYTYVDDTAESYGKAINKVAEKLEGKANVYDIVIPLSSGITFPDNLRDQVKSSDQREAMEKIQQKLASPVKVVDIYDTLMSHRQEYVYYRTDHHWTTLGAYYAYEQFCNDSGKEAEKLEEYETKEFDGFLGSFYNDTNGCESLKNHPDVVTAYYPHSDAICHVTASDGTKYDWPVVFDVSDYSAGLKYSAFIASDNPYTEIENKSITDGSSCVVVKESFGNAFIPFLVDHYQTIYVVDYRYWVGSVSALAEEKQASEVIFLNNLSMIRNKSLVGKINRVI